MARASITPEPVATSSIIASPPGVVGTVPHTRPLPRVHSYEVDESSILINNSIPAEVEKHQPPPMGNGRSLHYEVTSKGIPLTLVALLVSMGNVEDVKLSSPGSSSATRRCEGQKSSPISPRITSALPNKLERGHTVDHAKVRTLFAGAKSMSPWTPLRDTAMSVIVQLW